MILNLIMVKIINVYKANYVILIYFLIILEKLLPDMDAFTQIDIERLSSK